jgi:hypothetical protein
MVVPYPVANSTPVPWGLCRYVTSSNIQKVPVGAELSSMCARLMDVLQNTRYKHTSVLFELFSSRQYMNAKGLDEMAYAGRSADIQSLCMVQWESDDHTSAKTKDELNEAREVAKSIIRLGKPGEGPVYGNYRAYDLAYPWPANAESTNLLSIRTVTDVEGHDLAESLFGDKYNKLQDIKAKHDPNQLFNKWFPIAPSFMN